jgi:cytidine deaminase
MKNLSGSEETKLIDQAIEVTNKAHAPYSGFHVGAAILSKSGKTYVGCNVENASYGLTMCAERNAIFHGYAVEGDKFKPVAIAIATETDEANFSPCGACRQVMSEFKINFSVIYKMNGGWKVEELENLLPDSFSI